MKKILLIIFLLFISLLKAYAYDTIDIFYLGRQVPNMYIEKYDDTHFHSAAPFILHRSDGDFVYCINPFKYIKYDTNYYGYNVNNQIFNLTNEQLNRINLISYYGYNYNNHTDIKWYGITQFLIWKQMNYTDIYFTDKYHGVKIIAYVEEINELEKIVNDYYTLPSFANISLKYTVNSKYKLVDFNNVLGNYEVLETNIDVEKINNELYINTRENGNYQVKFIKRSPISRDYILYDLDGYQPLIYPGKINDITFTLNIEVNSGSITVNKIDSENKNRREAILNNAKYGLYIDNKIIATVETNELGVGYIDNLPFGRYYVKELIPSIGYNIDNTIYYVDLKYDNKDAVINSYEDVIKGNLIINKFYGNQNNYNNEDDAIFDVYDSNNNYINRYKTTNGTFNTLLEYGNYNIIQSRGKENYKMVHPFNINIIENKDYIYNLYDEIIEVEVPNTYKGKGINISLIFIIIGIILVLLSKIKTTNHC